MRTVRLSSSFRRSAVQAGVSAVVLTGFLAACSVDTVLTPPADIGPVGSIAPAEAYQPIAAEARVPGEEPSAAAFPVEPMPAPSVSSPEMAASAEQPVSSQALSAPSPEGGSVWDKRVVSVLDTDRVVEGTSGEPVVAGIGTGNPRSINAASSQRPAAAPHLAPAAARPGGEATYSKTQVAFDMRPASPAAPATLGEPPQSAPMQSPEGGMSASAAACRRELQQLGVRYSELPRISNGPACGIEHPIRVTGLSGGIRIKPAATLNCPVAVEFAKWIKRDVAPAARARYLSGIKSITQLSSYSCRTMNSQPGAPMSEHAHGNAIDIGSFTLNSGRTVDVRKPGFFAFRQRGFLNTVRADSCGYFNTVLGPGTNKYHWNHFHFDLRQRKSGRSYCE